MQSNHPPAESVGPGKTNRSIEKGGINNKMI